ncbi:MAG: hypothetical protein J6Y82_09655 [Bacteroidales bacterium]|nr:hypothetical protein [Bacteroidales bacterium]
MALELAGSNRYQMERVLRHFQNEPQKLSAAEFLICNMPAHHNTYGYENAQSDAQTITASFIIDVVDKTFWQWKNCQWAQHLTFDEYLEWILPYKVAETQQLDLWRDTLSAFLSNLINRTPHDDDEYNTATKVTEVVRTALREKYGYLIDDNGRSSLTSIKDLQKLKPSTTGYYSQLLVMACRSVGVPSVLDESALGGRIPTTMTIDKEYKTATLWPVILSSKGIEEPIANDISNEESYGFFPYDKCPKVYRNTFAINPERWEYTKNTKSPFSINLCKIDVTDKYFLSSDLIIKIDEKLAQQLTDQYVFIAAEVYGNDVKHNDWIIVDFGVMKNNNAFFNKMGRDINYMVLGCIGKKLIPICEPFSLHKNGKIELLK